MALTCRQALKLNSESQKEDLFTLSSSEPHVTPSRCDDASQTDATGDGVAKSQKRITKKKSRSCLRNSVRIRQRRIHSSPASVVRVSMTPSSTNLYGDRVLNERTTAAAKTNEGATMKGARGNRRISSAGYIDAKYTVFHGEFSGKSAAAGDANACRPSRGDADGKASAVSGEVAQLQTRLETVHVGSEVLRAIACCRYDKYRRTPDRLYHASHDDASDGQQKLDAFPVVRLRAANSDHAQKASSGHGILPTTPAFKYSHLFQRRHNAAATANSGSCFMRRQVDYATRFGGLQRPPAVGYLRRVLYDKITVHAHDSPYVDADDAVTALYSTSLYENALPRQLKSILKQPRGENSESKQRLSVHFSMPPPRQDQMVVTNCTTI